MDGFKNTTRMKTFGDEAPSCYAKGGAVKPAAKVGKVMGEFAAGKLHSGSKKGPEVTSRKQAIAIGLSEAKKAGAMKKADGGMVRMTDAERRASLEVPSRGMTPAEARALRATMAAKAAAPKRGPLIQPRKPVVAPQMSAADRRLIEMDRSTNASGSSEYKKGGKVGGSKVPFAVKKVMRKAEGGVVSQPQGMSPEMPQEPTPQSVFGTSPSPMPATDYQPLENMSAHNDRLKEAIAYRDAQAAQAQAQQAAQRADQAATLQAQQEMAAQAQMDRGLGRNFAPAYGRNPYLPRS